MGVRVTERGANERTDYGLKPRVIGRALPGSDGRTEAGGGGQETTSTTSTATQEG